MKWNDEYSIGIVEIDEQHKKLFELSEILNEATEINEIKDILLFLEEYMQFHFNTEESMMRKYNYELIEEHKKLHDDLKEKVTGYIELYFLGNSIKYFEICKILRFAINSMFFFLLKLYNQII